MTPPPLRTHAPQAPRRRLPTARRALLVSLVLLGGCTRTTVRATRVAQVLDVAPTGDPRIDAEFARVRAMQVTVNESDRDYLETLANLASRLSPSQDAELASVAGELRRRADTLFDQGSTLVVDLDPTSADAAVHQGAPQLGCDQFANVANVHRCHTELSRAVSLVIRERPATRLRADEDEGIDSTTYPETSVDWALSAKTAIAELVALRLRLGAVVDLTDPTKERLEALRVPASHRRELQDAIEFLTTVSARARVQRRLATTAAETLANAIQRTARVRGA
ncbi:MAG: hypothetical protein JNK05_24050 [Myxococcales bacterium]|nr:hypothetical protein [Myxococcales bacterium]